MKIKIKCSTCNGTGLYFHWSCKANEAQECAECKGTGYKEAEPFTEKEHVPGIDTVVTDAFGCMNPGHKRVPYTDWFKK